MEVILNADEIRVLGSLIEKEMTTPDYYPLTLNALMHACNQKSSRDPVVSFDEQTVVRALDGLREKKLARVVSSPDSRVAKYRQIFTDTANLTQAELALLCVLMLRGPQTVGELRGRTERLCNFERVAEVEAALQRLINRDSGALVMLLPRQTGLKEPRFMHLLAGEVQDNEMKSRNEPTIFEARIDNERISRIEQEIESLRRELMELKRDFSDFKKQFD
ncbi:MAG: DUF480 domain-containing protein [Acidobacteria bacterium]|nr:MAG: DUF480 domain-containing protein [Acidobacteriota bacterium]